MSALAEEEGEEEDGKEEGQGVQLMAQYQIAQEGYNQQVCTNEVVVTGGGGGLLHWITPYTKKGRSVV